MPKSVGPIQTMAAPVERAMVFICEKCGKRAGESAKHASYKLASKLKRDMKHEFGKREVRIVLTSCMNACPDDAIAISLQSLLPGRAPLFLEADVYDIEASSASLLKMVRRAAQ
jgi:predicted metal-binding protein